MWKTVLIAIAVLFLPLWASLLLTWWEFLCEQIQDLYWWREARRRERESE